MPCLSLALWRQIKIQGPKCKANRSYRTYITLMIQAIFFDFNGVIIDDERLQMEAYKDVLHEHAIELSESDYYGALGLDDKGFVRAAFARAEKPLADDVLKGVLAAKAVRHRKAIEDELPL